jgi:hypothetical protein
MVTVMQRIMFLETPLPTCSSDDVAHPYTGAAHHMTSAKMTKKT